MSKKKPQGKMIHWAWFVLGTSFITLSINFSIRIGAYPILLPEMIRDLHLTKAQAGLIKSAFAIAYLVFAPIMGLLTDRIGGRKVVSFFCLFLGTGALLMGKAESLLASAIFFGVVGIGAAAMWVPNATMIQRWFGAKKRGMALGILNASSGAGFGLMGLLLPMIVMEYNWRYGWFLLGSLGLSVSVLNGLLLRNGPEEVGLSPWGGKTEEVRGSDFPSKKISYFEILRQPQFWIIGISYLFASYGTYTLLDFIVTYGKMELNIPYDIASLLITVIAVSGIPGGILMMILSDHIGTKKSLLIIYVSFTLSILSIIFVGGRISLLITAAAWFGVIYGAIFPMVAASARDYLPKEATGTVLGLLTIFYGIGAMTTPIVTGYLADITGTFRWSFSLGAFAALLASFLTAFLKRQREFV
jgi:sugar phosphate permease